MISSATALKTNYLEMESETKVSSHNYVDPNINFDVKNLPLLKIASNRIKDNEDKAIINGIYPSRIVGIFLPQ